MITIINYYTETADLKKTDLPLTLWKGKEFVDKVTRNGETWDAYHSSESIKKTVDLYIKKLNEFLKKDINIKKSSKAIPKSKSKPNKELARIKKFLKTLSKDQLGSDYAYVFSADLDKVTAWIHDSTKSYNIHLNKLADRLLEKEEYYKKMYSENEEYKDYFKPKKKVKSSASKPKTIVKTIARQKKKTARQLAYEKADKVEVLSQELKFVKRFVLMHDKVKTQHQIRLFINALQKAIVEKRIRKTSPFAKEISKIQDYLLDLFFMFKKENKKITINLDESLRTKYLTLVGKEAELHSVKLIKSYINLQGKLIPNSKAKNLHNRVARLVNNGSVTKRDKYWKEIENILSTLKSFVKKNVEQGELMVSSKELNGLNDILSGCACEEVHGIHSVPKNTIMNSQDIINLQFNKLGFTGKWLNLIGNPSVGFRTMIFGKPKMGKSYLAVDYAGYLARNHGTVLYVAREEGIDDTLQQKLKDKNVAHPDLYVSDYLPEDLSAYDFVFLDSVNKLGLTPEDLERLDKEYPYTSFTEIFQTTKQGNFKGANEFQHDVDVIIEIPEKGKAVGFGRFNQGGEMNIFSQ
jgi:hypothetical protein